MRLATEIEFAKGFAYAAPAMYRNFSVIKIMRLATEIEFAKGFACAAPAMYRNFSVITMYNQSRQFKDLRFDGLGFPKFENDLKRFVILRKPLKTV